MSDSLRDQLLKAGFNAPPDERKVKPRRESGKQRNKSPSGTVKKSNSRQTAIAKQKADAAVIAQRKKTKAEIKALIEQHSIKDTTGDVPYSFVAGKKIRQLFLNSAAHEQLSSGQAVITRLNGSTHIIPSELVDSIRQLNPEWVIIRNQNPTTDDQSDGEYANFQVPDDLMW